jgi:signal peptidase I
MRVFRNIFGWFLFAATVVFLVLFATIQIVIPSKSIEVFGVKLFLVANTGSMEPELKTNDLIVIEKFDFDKVEINDYIAFEVDGTVNGATKRFVITHVVIDVFEEEEQKYFITRGISAPAQDFKPVTADGANGTNKYIGKYASKSSFWGSVIAYLQSPLGIITVGVDTACIIAIFVLLTKKDKKTVKINTIKIGGL